ncbi:hypothetical protein J6590_019117 [Homalodisca vitripennis]|nr:hypothetical protein J6590_019117 [Homalodisca vitripennis]
MEVSIQTQLAAERIFRRSAGLISTFRFNGPPCLFATSTVECLLAEDVERGKPMVHTNYALKNVQDWGQILTLNG